MLIHPQAVVSPEAEVGHDVTIGPFSVVEPDVVLGDGCRLDSHAIVKRGSTLGTGNQIFEGAVIGGLPQHAQMPERPGRLTIGNDNVFREACTVHRSLYEDAATQIGNGNLLMIGSHVAHDCRLEDEVILTNGVLVGGHVHVEHRAYLAGAVAVHQFCRIGHHAMVGGHARVLKDIPPYVTVDGGTGLIVGLNRVGLRRAGFSPEEIQDLKEAYRLIYRRGLTWAEVLEALVHEFPVGPAAEFHRFFAGSERGITQERRSPPKPIIKLHREGDADIGYSSKAG